MAQLLIYPAVEFTQSRPSFRENADGPNIKVASMPTTNAIDCSEPDDLRNPLAAPMMAADHAGLPAAFIAVAEHDPLGDAGSPIPRSSSQPACPWCSIAARD